MTILRRISTRSREIGMQIFATSSSLIILLWPRAELKLENFQISLKWGKFIDYGNTGLPYRSGQTSETRIEFYSSLRMCIRPGAFLNLIFWKNERGNTVCHNVRDMLWSFRGLMETIRVARSRNIFARSFASNRYQELGAKIRCIKWQCSMRDAWITNLRIVHIYMRIL